MLYLDVLLGGEKFRLPDYALEQKKPLLWLLHKGIVYIFKPVLKEYPGHEIFVIWDEDLKTLSYSSDTLEQEKISKVLNANHGNMFSK
jgi:hypothetical protein